MVGRLVVCVRSGRASGLVGRSVVCVCVRPGQASGLVGDRPTGRADGRVNGWHRGGRVGGWRTEGLTGVSEEDRASITHRCGSKAGVRSSELVERMLPRHVSLVRRSRTQLYSARAL